MEGALSFPALNVPALQVVPIKYFRCLMQGKRYVLDTKLERKNIIPLRFVDFP